MSLDHDTAPRRRPVKGLFRRLLRRRDGATAIEFAILAIPFFVIVFASIETFVAFMGDQLLANAAFYVTNALTTRADLPLGPWFVVVSGKVVALSQNRVDAVAEHRPGRLATILAWLARRRWPHLANPWAMRVTIDHSGLGPMLRTVLFGRPMPARADVYPPRVGAVAPADGSSVHVGISPGVSVCSPGWRTPITCV